METFVIVFGAVLALVTILVLGSGLVMVLREINLDLRLEAETQA